MSEERSLVDAIVVGGGLVGTAVAYGLVKQGQEVMLLDEGDVAHRASRGNFGLVWVQSKGMGAPHYQRWSRASATAWPQLAAEIEAATGLELLLQQPGGLSICLTEAELAAQDAAMARMRQEAGNFGFDYRILNAAETRDMVPGIGPRVVGAGWSPYDGHVSPLHLLHGLHLSFCQLGGTYWPNAGVTSATAAPGDFSVTVNGIIAQTPRIVLAAGLGNAALAPLFGLTAPVRPERGEIVVTERSVKRLDMPTACVRQTGEGSIMIGDSKEDAGFDTITQTPRIMRSMAQRAVLSFPWIADLNVVRAWSALRIMSPDGMPIYQQSSLFPGAFTANCHSGVTLAAAHALLLAPMIAAGEFPLEMAPFSAERFADVRSAA